MENIKSPGCGQVKMEENKRNTDIGKGKDKEEEKHSL